MWFVIRKLVRAELITPWGKKKEEKQKQNKKKKAKHAYMYNNSNEIVSVRVQ